MIEHVSGDMDLANQTQTIRLKDLISKTQELVTDDQFNQFLRIIMMTNLLNNPRTKQQTDYTYEYQYLTYLYGQCPEFEDAFCNFVLDACYAEFMEWYEYIVKHIMNEDVQQAFGLDLDNIMNWWAFRIDDIDTFKANLPNAHVIGNKMKKFFNERRTLSTVDEDYFESDHAQVVLDTLEMFVNNDRDSILEQVNDDRFLLMVEVYGWGNEMSYHILQFYNSTIKNSLS